VSTAPEAPAAPVSPAAVGQPAVVTVAPEPVAAVARAVASSSPVDSPLAAATQVLARRNNSGTPFAAATRSLFGNSITVNPDVAWSNGLLLGTLNAVSSRALPMTYKVVKDPSLGGKIAWAPAATQPDLFSYLPYMTTLSDPAQSEKFSIMVAEVTGFDTFMKKIPVVGIFVDPVLGILHRIPIVNSLLAPLIGAAQVVDLTESAAALAAGRPTDFTYLMPSFDGTLISVNYFPAVNVASGAVTAAPTVLNGPDLGFPGNTDVFTPWDTSLVNMVPGITAMRNDASPLEGGYVGSAGGYNVITWDPRGEYASGGIMQLDNPNFEGRDVSSIISWITSSGSVAKNQIATDLTGDPYIGMVGGSYGGGIQLAVAATPDKRVDAIVPSIAWNTLNQSLYPNNAFKTVIGSELLLALIATGARINNQIYVGIATGALFGRLSPTSQALLANSGPGVLTNNIVAPSMFLQGTPDILFELNASQANGQMITTSHPTVPVKTTWFCGGHGVCLLPQSDQAEQGKFNMDDTLRWLDQYVAHAGTPADAIPTFQWFDQTGAYHSAGRNPFDPAFNKPTPLTYQGDGGSLLLVPLIGGSGPSKAAVPPDKPTTFSTAFALASGSKAWNALNVKVTPPVGTQIAGSPTLSFSYSGLGTSKTVYAQLVDNATGEVVGNIVTPVPVTLDGRQHTVQIPMAPLAYGVYDSGDSMTLQITSSALPYANATAWGFIKIADINVGVPTVA
jgi:ABC-2 type transport system ATP-binding protein